MGLVTCNCELLVTRRGDIMRLEHIGVALTIAIVVALPSCVGENQTGLQSRSQGAIVKGGDDRTGGYDAVENW